MGLSSEMRMKKRDKNWLWVLKSLVYLVHLPQMKQDAV